MSSTHTTAVVALVVVTALAGGTAGAASPAGTQPVHGADSVQQGQQDDVNVSELVVENLSTSMTVENGTMTVERTDETTGLTETTEVTLDSASVDLTDATVEVHNATLDDGTIDLENATVRITDGTVEVSSSAGDRTIDLSDTNETVEDEVIVIEDVASMIPGFADDLEDATVTRMRLTGISGDAEVDQVVTNFQTESETGSQFGSIFVDQGNVSIEDGAVTLTNVTIDNGTLTAEHVNASADSAMVEADRVVLLFGSDLRDRSDVSIEVSDRTMNASDVEVELSNLPALFEQLVGNDTAAADTAG